MSTTPRLPSAIDGRAADFGTVLAHHPALARAFGATYGAFWSDGVLDHPTKEAVRLRNARITDCGY
jgi:alkylhydroperoxidase family enzyme